MSHTVPVFKQWTSQCDKLNKNLWYCVVLKGCYLFALAVLQIMCCPPFLPTAASAPGSRGSRPALPVAWTSSVRLITIRLRPRPRPRPLLPQPPPTPLQPHLPMVRVNQHKTPVFLFLSTSQATPKLFAVQKASHVGALICEATVQE